jgi:D-arabinose 1-dehydrogenase-like Zn-dependent alcohol dehydrogenase
MRAVVLRAAGGPEQLALEQVPTPVADAGEALVRVHAAAITRDELEWFVDRLPLIPSYEVSGVVAALGPGVGGIAVGDEVFGMTAFDRDGVAADYAAISAGLLAPKPRALSQAQAAAVPLAALSAWQGLFDHGGLVRGERVLIHGATGGVGGLPSSSPAPTALISSRPSRQGPCRLRSALALTRSSTTPPVASRTSSPRSTSFSTPPVASCSSAHQRSCE